MITHYLIICFTVYQMLQYFGRSLVSRQSRQPQCFCLENPRRRRPGRLPSVGRTELDKTDDCSSSSDVQAMGGQDSFPHVGLL